MLSEEILHPLFPIRRRGGRSWLGGNGRGWLLLLWWWCSDGNFSPFHRLNSSACVVGLRARTVAPQESFQLRNVTLVHARPFPGCFARHRHGCGHLRRWSPSHLHRVGVQDVDEQG